LAPKQSRSWEKAIFQRIYENLPLSTTCGEVVSSLRHRLSLPTPTTIPSQFNLNKEPSRCDTKTFFFRVTKLIMRHIAG
jgi:hypothetical protein